jgi:cephalosporin-C deacetylase-like acetyl esterase
MIQSIQSMPGNVACLIRLRALLPAAIAYLLLAGPASALTLSLAPTHADGIYAAGDTVAWQVTLSESGDGLTAAWDVRQNGATPIASGSLDLSSGAALLTLPAELPGEPAALLARVTLTTPGGATVTALGGAVVEPGRIRPLYPRPDDFDAFWDGKLAAMKALPYGEVVEEIPSGRADVILQAITLDSLDGSKVRLQLARPRDGDYFPGLVVLQYAGVYALSKSTVVNRAAKGWIAVNVMPHDLPMYESAAFYDAQKAGPLEAYGSQGNHDREEAYLLGMLLRAARATDYLASRPDWDGRTLVATGTSKGGYQAIAVAGLDPRVSAVAANVPAACEQSGPLGGRGAPWPYWINRNVTAFNQQAIHQAGRYFDTVNFAARVKAPVLVSMGLIDTTCPPSGVLSMVSELDGPVEVVIMPLAPHQSANQAHAAFDARAAEILATPPPADDGKARASALFGPGEVTGPAQFESDWLGTLDYRFWPWVGHPDLGWLHARPGDGESAWVHAPELGWLFFDPARRPWFYRADSGSWQFAFGESMAGRVFHDARARIGWSAASPPAAYTVLVHDSLLRAQTTLAAAAVEVASRTAYPSRTSPVTGRWNTVAAADWTSGFWPGCLWLMYDYTRDPDWRALAEEWNAGLAGQQFNTSTHDIGFMMFCSFGEGYRLTGNPDYRQILLNSAASLETRYSSIVKGYRSWSWGRWDDNRNFTIIADNMMNLELLWWAASQPGGLQIWADHALQHALTTEREHLRDDDSTYHVIVFDRLTGQVLERTTLQGADDDSDWARGQAWVVYGYVMAYHETGDTRMLDAARRTAAFFIDSLPADGVPPWDFALANPATAPRDTSAAAIVASALIELSRLVDEGEAAFYWDTGLHILQSLMSAAYQNGQTSAILDHGTAHFPAGSYDTGLIWGDYYFLEALLRYLDRIGR